MNRNIIITGGTGFLGSNLVRTFSGTDKVFNLGRNKNQQCENINWNLKDRLVCKKIPDNIDTIIHCAAIVGEGKYSKREYIEINLLSTLELLEHCTNKGVTHFVYISSGGVYGFGKDPFKEDNPQKPEGIYSISKYFSEELCKGYEGKVKITILRIFFPYGKGQQGRLLPMLINKVKNNEEIILNNWGAPMINPIYIEDFCNIVEEVVKKRVEGTFNVCGNDVLSIKELCEIIRTKFQVKKVKYTYNGKNVENIIGNNDKIKNALNYTFKTNIFEGMGKTIYS